MESDEPPQLQHGIPDPETYLPGIPEWFWWLTGLGGLIVAIFAGGLLFCFLAARTIMKRPLLESLRTE